MQDVFQVQCCVELYGFNLGSLYRHYAKLSSYCTLISVMIHDVPLLLGYKLLLSLPIMITLPFSVLPLWKYEEFLCQLLFSAIIFPFPDHGINASYTTTNYPLTHAALRSTDKFIWLHVLCTSFQNHLALLMVSSLGCIASKCSGPWIKSFKVFIEM